MSGGRGGGSEKENKPVPHLPSCPSVKKSKERNRKDQPNTYSFRKQLYVTYNREREGGGEEELTTGQIPNTQSESTS